MTFWDLIWIIGGVTLLGVVIAHYTGTLSVILQFMQAVFSFFQQILGWVFTESPKPIRIILILIIILAVGGFIVNNTFGAQYVCVDHSVKKTSWLEGITYKWFPDQSTLQTINDGIQEDFSEYKETSNVADIPIYTPDNMILQNIARQYEYGDFKGIEALMTPGMARQAAGAGLVTVAAISPLDQFQRIICNIYTCDLNNLNFEYKAVIDVCLYDGSNTEFENTCIARLRSPSDTRSGISACDYPIDWLSESDFSQQVGYITYYYESSDQLLQGLHVDINRIQSLDVDIITRWDLRLVDFEDCEDNAVINAQTSPTVSKATMEYQFEGKNLYQVPIYQLTYGPLLIMNTGQPWVDVLDTQKQLLETSKESVLGSFESNDEALGGIVKYACNDETDDPYDVNMKILNIDILDPKVLAVLVLIGIVFGVYKWSGIFGK